jgi:hypothetical protein
MAFQSAVGYNNLPLGNFSPEIWSKKTQLAFRKATVAEEITNSEYMGEISGYGDSVRIILEPEIDVAPYARGTQMQSQNLVDNEFTLQIDKANAFQFAVDDIETLHSHIGWESLATNRAGYRLRDNYDQEILGYMSGFKQANLHENASVARVVGDIPGTKAVSTADDDEFLASMKLDRTKFGNLTTSGSAGDSIPVAPRLSGETSLPTGYVSPLMIFARMKRLLDQQNVPKEGRWLVIDPVMCEVLTDEGNRLVNSENMGDGSEVTNGRFPGKLYGFTVYESNNLPEIGNGPGTADSTAQSTNYGVIIAGHYGAVATAEQLNKVESFRSQNTFGDVVRGMHVYGRKILRSEALTRAIYNLA